MNLLGISGKKQTGKNTIASIIANHLTAKKHKVFEIAFADALKEEVCKACGVTIKELEANKSIFRPMLQWWGTDYRRNYKGGETYWTDQLVKKLATFPNDCTVIVTDVRFPNEANLIKEVNGQLWRVCRIHKDFSELDGHHSEIALDDYQGFDELITNNCSSVEELRPRIINLYHKYYGKAIV